MNSLRVLRAGINSAFTLIELLVAVLLVIILAAILLPVFGKVRSSSLSGKCLQKQRTIYMALLRFSEDHRGLICPSLGATSGNYQTKEIHPDFNVNQYWYDTAYLGRYVLNQPNRSRWSTGMLTGEELISFQCPAQLNPTKTSYVMQRVPFNREKYNFHSMENRASNLFLTEGVAGQLSVPSALTDPVDSTDSSRRLRRFHNGGLNILFFDGHVEHFTGPDAEIAQMLKLQ